MDDDKGDDDAAERMSVPLPNFGDWNPENGEPDYSLNFDKIMETRKKKKKKNFNRSNIGHEMEFIPTPQPPKFEDNHRDNINVEPIGGNGVELNRHRHDRQSLTPTHAKKTIWNYLTCCNKTKCV